jgi:hypothetical protein
MSKCYLVWHDGRRARAIELRSGRVHLIWDDGNGTGRALSLRFDDPEELWHWFSRLYEIAHEAPRAQ